MKYFTKEFLFFLKKLNKNNNREWFKENKDDFILHVKEPFEIFINDLITEIKKKYIPDLSIDTKQSIFRIYRDVRFSKNKTPYQTHVSAIISPGGRKDKNFPGIYIHIGHGEAHLAGGCYDPDKHQLANIRRALINQKTRVKKIINQPALVNSFGELRGEKNKIVPKEFKEAAADWPLLLNKQYYFMSDLDPKALIEQKNIKKYIIDQYKLLKPWNDFLRETLYE